MCLFLTYIQKQFLSLLAGYLFQKEYNCCVNFLQ